MLKDDKHIRWQCHRGMLECDLILLKFFDQHYHALSDEQKQNFQALLAAPDPELLAWLMGHEDPAEKELREARDNIRQALGLDPAP